MIRLVDFLIALLVTGVLTASPAMAYLDGATVSLFLQAVTGAVAGVLMFGRAYLARLSALLRGSRGVKTDDSQG